MNQIADFIIPECFVDTNLVETLACNKGCNHQKGCNQVAKIMNEKYADRFAVGIVDADKRFPSYLNEFNEIVSSQHLKVCRHSERPHFIILICPAIDKFILDCVEFANINMEDYDLPSLLKDFTQQTKQVLSNRDPRFRKLFKDLKNSGEIKILKELLNYFLSKLYQSSNEDILKIFNQGEDAKAYP